MDIFRSEGDKEVLVVILAEAAGRHQVDINGYALMRNHIHLLVTPRTATALEKFMHRAGFQYAQYFNRKHCRTGPLFEGRYRPTVVDTDVYWYSCLRYVELNPVRAGVVMSPSAHRWTSYAAHAHGDHDPLVTFHELYLALGATPQERQQAWQTMCGRGLTIEELGEIRAAVRNGGILGRLVVVAED